MFNLPALIKLINTNSYDVIQQSEMSEFLKSQDSENPSIFTEYFNSIKSDISVGKFIDGINNVIRQACQNNVNPNLELSFKQQEVKKRYEQLQIEIQIKTNLYNELGYKFKSNDEFNAVFDELLIKYRDCGNEMWARVVSDLVNSCSSTTPVDWMSRLNTGKFHSSGTLFQNIVFDDVDLSGYEEAFRHIAFNENTFAKVSPENLPPGFNPQQVFEKGKTIGLSIDQAHAGGYTGKGISYAIIDSGTLDENGQQHNDIHFKEYNLPQYATQSNLNHFHGRAVSYIAQEIAPDADCYYYAAWGKDINTSVLDNLRQILEKNKNLPYNQKIRFVSMSMPLYGSEETKQVVAELEAQGVWVYYCGCPYDIISYVSKKDPNGDPNDFDNYEIYASQGAIYVNSGDRTVPDPSSPTAYRHDGNASASWAVPVIAGYYTLACQADPSMTPEKFIDLAQSTAHITTSTIPNRPNGILINRSEEEIEIKIIDINALLQAIENEKAQQAK